MPYKKYYFYSRIDKNQEPINAVRAWNRKEAALYFAERKQMSLKQFLSVFAVSR